MQRNNVRFLPRTATYALHLISPAGSDYTPVTADLTFNSTNAAIPQTVTIPILDDLLLEGSEVFNVTLTGNNSNVTLLPELTTVTIQDVESKLKEEINHTVVALGYGHLVAVQ